MNGEKLILQTQTYKLEDLDIIVPEDIIVQDFIEGRDHSCVVIKIYDTLVALNLTGSVYPLGSDSRIWAFKRSLKLELLKEED